MERVSPVWTAKDKFVRWHFVENLKSLCNMSYKFSKFPCCLNILIPPGVFYVDSQYLQVCEKTFFVCENKVWTCLR